MKELVFLPDREGRDEFSSVSGLVRLGADGDTLQKLSDRGMTIVMTSHFPSHAWQVGTKVVLMGRKGIIAQGTPEEIMTEDHLSDIYDVRVRIVNKQTEGSKAFFCEPCFD